MRIGQRVFWVGVTAAAIVAIAASSSWCAPRHPFAVGAQESVGAATGFAGLILAWQSKFQTELQAAVRALKTDPSAFLALAAASFAYGAFHAAGPGHGKAVLASYMLANETALKRGLLLAALAALLQGLVAIAIVGAAAAVFRATAREMSDATRLIELVSYAAVTAVGARLAWVKGRALSAALSAPATASTTRGFVCEAIDDPAHVHDENCRHAPDPSTLIGPKFRLADAAATVVAAGLRPCSGAILILAFTLSQGLFSAGAGAVVAMSAGTAITTGALAATAVYAKSAAVRLGAKDSRRAVIIARSGEFIAAILVLALGVTLLLGLAPAATGAA
ncbi:MAG: high frequency lysogenization protein HflD [Alphaproteobacteria bacterium]|nr:high frequency lysogenization protein HflD [Alphaproteobacteria bacterium]MBM3640044.1 high frequency lysogenization protein HflD [Alphaproteobacteria bacterium]